MPTWRCPHCGTPQEETARCWVCRRSSTACGTCRHFRRSVAAQMGYCGLDRRRTPLVGDEIRACWEVARGEASAVLPAAPRPTPAVERAARLEFIEVDSVRRPTDADVAPRSGTEPDDPRPPSPPASPAASPGWMLWGDGDL